MRPSHPLNAPLMDWHIYSLDLSHETKSPTPPPIQSISRFKDLIRLQPTAPDTTHVLTPRVRCISDKDIMTILDIYVSPLILAIDGSFKPSATQHEYPPNQPHHPTIALTATSVTITAINNYHPTKKWMDLPTIPLLSRVQPLPPTYGTNNVTNNAAELLVRVLACELLPHDNPAIVIYDSTVVDSQHLALFGASYTNRQRTRTVFPAISQMLAQRLEVTNVRANPPTLPTHDDHNSPGDDTPTIEESVIQQIMKMYPCGKTWIPSKHLTLTHNIVYIKIKSHQLRSNVQPKYHASPQPCFALVHINHWPDKTCELPHTDNRTYPFPIRCTSTCIT